MGVFLDIHQELRTNGAFRDKLLRHQAEIKSRLAEKARGACGEEKIQEAVLDLLQFCRWNASLLVPLFFPAFPSDQPFLLGRRPHAMTMMSLLPLGHLTFRAGRQVGKSSTIGVRQHLVGRLIPGYRSYYFAPHGEHVRTYANRVNELSRACVYPVNEREFKQNMYYREWPGGGVTELMHILTDSGPARGKTADENIFDEYQLFEMELEPDILQSLRISKYKTRIYAGTSTVLDSPLEQRFLAGSQGMWHAKCESGHWTNFNDKEIVPRMIHPRGLVCPHCEKKGVVSLLNPENGFYIHAFKDRLEAGYPSLHIPQVIVPDFVLDPVEWSTIYTDFMDYGEAKFMQEVMGIPVEEGMRELTMQDLLDLCSRGLETEDFNARIALAKSGKYQWIVSGCDWGGSDYLPELKTKLSYTVHAIIGIDNLGNFDILHFKHYASMNYEEIAHDIVQHHRMFRGDFIASDFGAGQAYNMLLRKELPPQRHIVFAYTAQNNRVIARPPHGMFNQLSLSKTESLSSLFIMLKNRRQKRIRCYSWEAAKYYLLQFLNLYRVPTDSDAGGSKFRYIRHGSKADDALHALNFAVSLGRLVIGEPIVDDPSLRRELMKALGQDVSAGGAAILGYPIGGGYVGG